MSSFPGQPPKAPEAPAPLREYEVIVNGDLQIVWAHYLTRDPGHVCFWKTRTDNVQDTLVVAITNTMLDELKEISE